MSLEAEIQSRWLQHLQRIGLDNPGTGQIVCNDPNYARSPFFPSTGAQDLIAAANSTSASNEQIHGGTHPVFRPGDIAGSQGTEHGATHISFFNMLSYIHFIPTTENERSQAEAAGLHNFMTFLLQLESLGLDMNRIYVQTIGNHGRFPVPPA